MQEFNAMYRIDTTAYARLYTYESVDEDTCAVTGYTLANPVCLMVPSLAPDGRTVVAIADSAFEGQSQLRAIFLPDTVERVGRRAFAYCTDLRVVLTGVTSRLSAIDDRAFLGCEHMKRWDMSHLSALRTIGRHAFAHCTGLSHMVLPEGLSELSASLFEDCVSLRRVHLPVALTVIHTAAFAACTSLASLTLPASVAVIEDCAFAWCASLRTVRLPDAACLVAASAFKECAAMEDVFHTV